VGDQQNDELRRVFIADATRRRFVTWGAGAALGVFGLGHAAAPTGGADPGGNGGHMTTFVLVHGAWHGGWCWRKLASLLRAAGHEALTPTLTGLGERAHLAHQGVDLATHVRDVVNMLEYDDLHDVVLVGHSYGGMVITGVAEQSPARLARLVYMDAFVPDDGQALVDLASPEARQGWEVLVRAEGDGWQLPTPFPAPWEEILRDNWSVTDEDDIRWMLPRLGPHPFATMTQPVRRLDPVAAALPRTYLRCADNPSPTFVPFAERAERAGSGWHYRELASNHEAMVTAPRQLADILLESV
jgi:pimeloyl-ACP methyl ester carboxylesterase